LHLIYPSAVESKRRSIDSLVLVGIDTDDDDAVDEVLI